VNSLANFPCWVEWLGSERAFYAELTAQLESRVLTVPKDKLGGLLANEETAYEKYGESEVRPTWKEIDSELEELPIAICDVGNDLMIEWAYIIDLDNELFSVDNWIFFDLRDIPRDRWIQAFECDDEGRKVFSFEICPEGSDDVDPPEYFADDATGERDKYRAICQQYSHLTVEAISGINVSSQAAIQQIVAIMLFEKTTTPYASHFWEYLPGWGHENFAFREVAFAILSFAAGQHYFDDPNRFYGHYRRHESNGYLIDRNEGGEPKLMPLFGSGCHSLDQEPGSAPPGSIYWFENVLISLVPNTVFEKDTEAAIAKAVEYGLEEGKINFQVVVFSILNAIMLEVHVKDGAKAIRRTGVVSIYNANRENDRGDSGEDGNNDNCETNAASPLEQICRKHSGFVSLQNFFKAAANRHLSVFSNGRFPAEIYAKIIANADSSTRNACAKVSRTFHALCQERFSFSNNLTILKFEASTCPVESQNQRQRWPWVDINDLGIFTFQDQDTGHIMRSGLNVRHQVLIADEKKVTTWCPVVGGVARPSMMTQLQMRVFLPTRNQKKSVR
jgi:hypothetical protein